MTLKILHPNDCSTTYPFLQELSIVEYPSFYKITTIPRSDIVTTTQEFELDKNRVLDFEISGPVNLNLVTSESEYLEYLANESDPRD